MDDKELIKLLKSDGEKLSSNSFAAIRKKIEKTDRYIALQVKNETEPMIPNSVPEVEAKQKHPFFNWKVFTPVAVSCCVLVALPIVISQVNQPVTKCDAYVGVSYEAKDHVLDLRMQVKDDVVDLDTITSKGELGNMLLSGIIKENRFTANPTLPEFLTQIKQIATEYTLIDANSKETLEFICSDKNVGDKYSTEYSLPDYILMEEKSDLKNIENTIIIYDILNRLFGVNKFDEETFKTFTEITKNSTNIKEITAILEQINESLPLDQMVENFRKIIDFTMFKQIEDSFNTIKEIGENFLDKYIDQNGTEGSLLSFWNHTEIPDSQNKDEYWLNYWYNRLNLKRGKK